MGSPFDDHAWQRAQEGLRRVYDQFKVWQNDSDAYDAVREKWYRALSMEIGARTSSVEEYVSK